MKVKMNVNMNVNLNSKQHFIYNIIISTFAFFSVIFIMVDFVEGLSTWQLHTNRVLFVVFFIDFLIRFIQADDKKAYFKRNFWDMVAIIPFHGVFPIVKIVNIDRFLKLLNVARIIAFLVRPMRKAKPIFDTNGFKYVILSTIGIVLLGGVLIHFAEGMSFIDGIWWAFVTATTVGYGDLSPTTVYGRLIAMVLMLVGIGLLGSVTSTLTSFFMKSTKKDSKNQIIENIKNQLDDFDHLSKKDVDIICKVLKSLKK